MFLYGRGKAAHRTAVEIGMPRDQRVWSLRRPIIPFRLNEFVEQECERCTVVNSVAAATPEFHQLSTTSDPLSVLNLANNVLDGRMAVLRLTRVVRLTVREFLQWSVCKVR